MGCKSMKINLTGYRVMSPGHAVRVETKEQPDFNRLLGKETQDVSDAEFFYMLGQLTNFWEQSRYEYSAIYFWVEN